MIRLRPQKDPSRCVNLSVLRMSRVHRSRWVFRTPRRRGERHSCRNKGTPIGAVSSVLSDVVTDPPVKGGSTVSSPRPSTLGIVRQRPQKDRIL